MCRERYGRPSSWYGYYQLYGQVRAGRERERGGGDVPGGDSPGSEISRVFFLVCEDLRS